MRSRAIVSMSLCAGFLGVLFWSFYVNGRVEQKMSGGLCAEGQCAVQTVPTEQAAPSTVKWPPKLGEPYPDLELTDQSGRRVRLSSFKGRVLLIEPVGMTCPACQAFSGAHRYGSFEGVVPQQGLPSIEELFPRYTNGLSLSDERIVFAQLLLYNMSMGVPTLDDARRWAEHFKLARLKNHFVLAGAKELLGPASYNLIPGFQLVDRNFVMRADSTGHQPRHNLFTELLPMVPGLLEEKVLPSKVSARMSVEEAYRAIPHRRTVFDSDLSNMAVEERVYLQQFLRLIDLAIVERVEMWSLLKSGEKGKSPDQDYDEIVGQLTTLTIPPRLRSVHHLVLEAVNEQKAALQEWRKTGLPASVARHPLVVSSSKKLRQAYAEMLSLFPNEEEHNKAAFFDYLCALDFI